MSEELTVWPEWWFQTADELKPLIKMSVSIPDGMPLATLRSAGVLAFIDDRLRALCEQARSTFMEELRKTAAV